MQVPWAIVDCEPTRTEGRACVQLDRIGPTSMPPRSQLREFAGSQGVNDRESIPRSESGVEGEVVAKIHATQRARDGTDLRFLRRTAGSNQFHALRVARFRWHEINLATEVIAEVAVQRTRGSGVLRGCWMEAEVAASILRAACAGSRCRRDRWDPAACGKR